MAGTKAIASPVTMNTSPTYSSGSGVPPVASRQRQRSQHHSTPSTALLIPPQYQSALGTLAHALTDPPAHPSSSPQVGLRRGTVGHQRTRSDVHPPLHAVHSPPFAFPRDMVSPIQEENMPHVGYISPPHHAPVDQHPVLPDLLPTPLFPPIASTPSFSIYPHTLTNTSPPPNPLSAPQHVVSGPSGSAHRSTSMGYTTHPPYAYPPPSSFVPAHIPLGHNPLTIPSLTSPPLGQENQGTWWYPHPGPTVAANLSEGMQREFQPQLTDDYPPPEQPEGEHSGQRNVVPLLSEPQPTRSPTTQIRTGGSLNTKLEATQAPSPTSPTSPRTRHQERRSYYPNPPAGRSEWVMWVGNVPSDVKQDELREFFNQPLPRTLSPTSTEPAEEDGQRVYGGVSSVFIISRSNCAFVNFETEAHLEAATARFNGRPLRPGDQRCARLVCRVWRREDDLMAGVGGQRGSSMHIKWIKEQKAKGRYDSRWSREADVSTHLSRSRSVSNTSTNSDILTGFFPKRYFILKSLTQVLVCPALLKPHLIHTLAVRSRPECSEEYLGNAASQ